MPHTIGAPVSRSLPLPSQPAAIYRREIQPPYLLLRGFPTPAIEQLWQDFVERVEYPDLYCTPHYFLEPHWKGKNPFAILALHQDRVAGVATGLDEGAKVTCGLPARPQTVIDSVDDAGTTAQTLAKALMTEFPRARLITAYSWSSALADGIERQRFRARQLLGDVVLDLRPGADALFDAFHDNRKRNIRAAIRRGVEISEVNNAQDLADYWSVYCEWLKTERKSIHASRDFERIAEVHRLQTTHRQFLARHKGKAIAATTVRFYPGGLIEYSSNCSIDEFNRLRPNDLLVWTTIQWACAHGFARYSLGAAHPFLRKCGGAVVPIYRYRLDRTFLRQVELKEKARELARRFFGCFGSSGLVFKKCLKRIVAA